MQYTCRYLLLVFFLIPSAAQIQAEPIYKHKNVDGTISFSSEPPTANAKPAKLPKINKGEMTIRGKPLETCDRHGGINCQAGPSAAGNVICFDGYDGASARYRFSCSSTKLEVADISALQDDGSLSVTIRNTRSIAAQSPEVYLRINESLEVALVGPEEISAFGVGEFLLDAKDRNVLQKKPHRQAIRILCRNCS